MGARATQAIGSRSMKRSFFSRLRHSISRIAVRRRAATLRAAHYATESLENRRLLTAVVTATLTDNTATSVLPGSTIHYTEVVSNTAAVGGGNDALLLQIANTLD